jgi:hypothetical protein
MNGESYMKYTSYDSNAPCVLCGERPPTKKSNIKYSLSQKVGRKTTLTTTYSFTDMPVCERCSTLADRNERILTITMAAMVVSLLIFFVFNSNKPLGSFFALAAGFFFILNQAGSWFLNSGRELKINRWLEKYGRPNRDDRAIIVFKAFFAQDAEKWWRSNNDPSSATCGACGRPVQRNTGFVVGGSLYCEESINQLLGRVDWNDVLSGKGQQMLEKLRPIAGSNFSDVRLLDVLEGIEVK